MSIGPLSDLERKLSRLPAPTVQEYRRSCEWLGGLLTDEEMEHWAVEGLNMAHQTPRSWEVAVEYFRASREIARFLPFSPLIQWARCGFHLTQDSPALAVSYFRVSPEIVPNMRPHYIPRWVDLGRSLFKGTWRSSTLAVKFFEISPGLIRNLPPWDLEVFCALIESLAHKSHDVAMECLIMGERVLSQMSKEREAFLALLRSMTDGNWRQVKASLELATTSLSLVQESQRARFLRIAERLCQEGYRETVGFLTRGSKALGRIDSSQQRYILDLCDLLLASMPHSVPAFVYSLDQVLMRINANQLDIWFQQGLRLLKENPEAGLAYFKLESNTSEQVIETLSSSIELDRVKGVLRLYCRAMSGAPMEILTTKELVDKGIGWVSESQVSTEGSKIFLPPTVDRYPHKRQNFAWFKVVSTHQVSHLEFGSFRFSFHKSSTLFRDKRPQWEQRSEERGREIASERGDASSGERGWLTDMGRFFNLFMDRRLSLDIYTALEDGRLDCRVLWEYPGIRSDYRWVQRETLGERPPMERLPVREALVEFLVRLSLGQTKGVKVPKSYRREVRAIARIVKHLLRPEAEVEDTAEATIRVYDILSRLSNRQESEEEFESQDFDEESDYSEEELEQLLSQMSEPREEGEENKEEGEESYQSPQDVDYRGDFKPELVQVLNELRSGQQQGGQRQEQDISKEMLEELLKNSAELQFEEGSGDGASSMSDLIQNIMKEVGVPPPQHTSGQGHGPIVHEEERGGPLEARDPSTFTYDEWDFRAADYKPKWCIVREKSVEDGDVRFYNDVLRSYAPLMSEIRRQFELVIPESFRKIKRLKDGEDLDLDAMVEAAIDRRSGVTPSEKVYWKRNKVERDVAVVFLLDMSASTAEAIDDGRRAMDDQSAPDDPVEYMMWLRTRREGLARRHYKRIIDLEKESTVLLIQALETIGDTYGIYGFSGYGRENVEFYVVKDIEEAFSEKTKRRLDRVTPLHATRMGPAIRHATSKLEQQDARTRILFLISDGRPQDRGYSREGVEKEYAVHDTHMALVEAKRKKITPFCLTVDRAGHDYLKTMCGDLGYEVLEDIWSLPRRLPMLYRRLTV